ncbi:MAG: CoA transferase subunit A, partial [Desulfobacterales bacterium]|nr:CoA transferase subunit A [Desulfobacterales bacterium]
HDAFIEYRNESKTPETFEKWLRLWVEDIKTSDDYIRLLGNERVVKLKLKNHLLSEPVDYGY